MRPCCSHADRIARRAATSAPERQVQPVPDVVADDRRGSAARGRTATAARARCGRRLEDLADRLAEAFGRVLHARRLLAESRNPTAARAARGRDRSVRTGARSATTTAATREQDTISGL